MNSMCSTANRKLILNVCPNACMRPSILKRSLVACNEYKQCNFSGLPAQAFADDFGAAIRAGLGKLRELKKDDEKLTRCLSQVIHNLTTIL